MGVSDLVRSYYGADDGLTATILGALSSAGVDVDSLAPDDLSPIDHLHAGGAAATSRLLDHFDTKPGERMLDVGCGVGGPSRMAAGRGFAVTGVDLTPEFVETAIALTARVGMNGNPRFMVASAKSLPFDDGSFDAAVMVHAGMNMPDKAAVFREIHRVVVPGARFGVYDQMLTDDKDLEFPLPWAEDARSSFLETQESYSMLLEDAGFTVESIEDHTDAVLQSRAPAAVGPADVYGPVYVDGVGNYVAAARAGKLHAVLITAISE